MRIYKDKSSDKVWWVDNEGVIGEFLFTFDKKHVYNLFRDYPQKLSVEDWITFNKENAYWANFFRDRNLEYAMSHLDELEKLGREDLIKKFADSE